MQHELEAMMSSNSPESNGPTSDGTDEPLTDQDGPLPPLDLVGPFLITPTTLRHELIIACRKSAQLKLHPYQHDTINEFVWVETSVHM